MKETLKIRFSSEEVKLFSAASHDRNPLHISADYAYKTPYAKPVVFGVLGGLAVFKHFQPRSGYVLSKIVLDFPGAILSNTPYQLEIIDTSPVKATATIKDGKRLLLKLTAQFQPDSSYRIPAHRATAQSQRLEPNHLQANDLHAGYTLEGHYHPEVNAFLALQEHFNLQNKGIAEVQLTALLWSSYLVGMELPGRQALFAKLVLNFEARWIGQDPTLSYTAQVTDYDSRFSLLRNQIQLAADDNPLAVGEIRAFLRPDSPQPDLTLLPRSDDLKGKVALITGASRGLGAALAQALAFQGCTVVANFFNSEAAAKQVQANVTSASGKIVLQQGNASDPSWCKATRQQIDQDYGKLDFLICNASPPIRPLWLDSHDLTHLNQFVQTSLTLTSVPMATFLEQLTLNSGWGVAISSVYVKDSPAEFPHYVAAKCAMEGLMQVAAKEYPQVNFLIARPPKLLTDQTNTPLGRQDAISTTVVTEKIVQRLRKKATQKLEILEDFSKT